MPRPSGSNAVEKTLAVLDALGEHERIADISDATGIHKSTVHRILQDFTRLGFARVTDQGTYQGGSRILGLAGRVLARSDAAERARPELVALQRETGATVHLALLDGHEAVYVAKVEGAKPYRMASRVGMAMPLHCTAIGKVLLAWESADRQTRALAGCDFKRFREKTITDRTAFAAELERTREQGFGQDREEFDEHIRCVGVPIFDRHNQAVAGLSVSFPTFRFDVAREPAVVGMLQQASRVVSKQLGCTNYPLPPAAGKATTR